MEKKSWLNPTWHSSSQERTGSVDAYGSIQEPSTEQLLGTYEDTVFACVSRRSEAVSSLPLRLYAASRAADRKPQKSGLTIRTKSTPGRQEVSDHPLLELLDSPNPEMSRKDLVKCTVVSLDLTGNAFWRIQRWDSQEGAYPAYLWPLNAQYVEAVVDYGRIVGWKYNLTSPPGYYCCDDVIHFKYTDPSNMYGLGYGPTRAAYERILLVKNEQAYLASLYKNQSRFDSLIKVQDGSKDECERLQKQIEQRFRAGGMGGPWVVPGGAASGDSIDVTPLSWSPRDVLGTELYKWNNLKILNCFAIHPSLFDSESSNRSTSYEARHDFQLNAVLPIARVIEEKINHVLSPQYDDRLMLEFDTPVEEDAELVTKQRLDYVNSQIKTINEARAELGLPPVSWGAGPSEPKPAQPPEGAL